MMMVNRIGCNIFYFCDNTIATISPYKARASLKISINIIPTYNPGCFATALTP